jgi:hypothetical protein
MIFDDSISTCLVRDYSPVGARLRVPANIQVPRRFELHLSRSAIQHKVQLRWCHGDEIGVTFDGKDKVLRGSR